MKIIKDGLLLLLICTLLLAGLWGLFPTRFNDSVTVGSFKLAPFSSGFSLYQNNNSSFYTISPYNDYVGNNSGILTALVTKDDIINRHYTYQTFPNILAQKIDYLKSLFNLSTPVITYSNFPTTIKYQANIDANKITISRTLTHYPLTPINFSGLTLSYQCSDIVFDNLGHVYSSPSPQSLKEYNQLHQSTLSPTSLKNAATSWYPINADTLTIVNPSLAGTITIQKQEQQSLKINPDYCLLAAESADDYFSSMTILINPSP